MNICEQVIKQAIDLEIRKSVEVAVENAKKELDRRIPEIVAGLAIKIMKNVKLEEYNTELVIHIRMDKS